MAITLRLTDEQHQMLAALAAAQGITKHEAAVRAITDAAARKLSAAQVAVLSRTARERYSHLLQRLAE